MNGCDKITPDEQRTPVGKLIEQMNISINGLRKAVDKIIAKIDAVLAPEEVTESKDNLQEKEGTRDSELVKALISYKNEIESMTVKLNHIGYRIQL